MISKYKYPLKYYSNVGDFSGGWKRERVEEQKISQEKGQGGGYILRQIPLSY
jgi:hypothetical protein